VHNRSRIAEAKAAAEAAGASEAGSSRTGPSVRDRSNPRPSMLAALTTRCLAQRTASVTALARTLGCAPKTLTELVDKAAEDNQSQTLSRIDAKLAPPDPNKPREVFRYDFKKAAIMWELRQNNLARRCALAVEPPCPPPSPLRRARRRRRRRPRLPLARRRLPLARRRRRRRDIAAAVVAAASSPPSSPPQPSPPCRHPPKGVRGNLSPAKAR
jgi:hypothetical protein